jgi:hypothetical protein
VPEAHTLLIVVAGTSGKPANLAACVAGAWPKLADKTLPINTSCTSSGFMPDCATAAFMAMPPSWVAVKPDSEPPKLPIGVLSADTITTSLIDLYYIWLTAKLINFNSPTG